MARTQGSPRGGRLLLKTTHRQQQTVKEEEGKHRQQDVQQQQLRQAQRCGEQQHEMQQQLQQRQETEDGKHQQGMRQDITAAVTADKTVAGAAPVTIAMSSCSSGGTLQPCSPVRGSVVARSASHRKSHGNTTTTTNKTNSSQSSSASTGNTRSSSIFSGTSEDNRKNSRNLSVRRGNDSGYGSPAGSSSSTRKTPNSSSNSSSSCIREEPDESTSSQNSSDTAVPGSSEETNLSSSHVDGGQTNERSGAKCPANSSSSPANTRSTGNCDTRGSSSRSSSTHFSVENGSNWVQRLVRENSSSSGAATGDSSKSHLPMKDCNSSSSHAGVRSTSKNFMGREEDSSRGVGGGAATAAGGRRTTVIRPRTDGSTTVIEEAPTTPATSLPPQPRDGWAARMPILRLRVDPTTGDVLLADELPPEERQASRRASPSPPPVDFLKTGELSPSPLSTGTSTEPPTSPEPAEGRSIVSSPGASACSPGARQTDRSGDRAQSDSQQIGSSRVRFNSSSFSVEGMQRRRQEEEAEEERSAALLRYRLGSELAAAGAAAAALHSGAAGAGSEAYAAASRRAEWERQTDRTASRAAAGSGPAASSSRQVVSLGGGSRRARIVQHETYTETLHRGGLPTAAAEEGGGETQGFVWGEKVAHDGSWRERWIQQVIVEEESDYAQWRVRPEATQQQGQQQQQQQTAAAGEPQAPLVGATLGARAYRADAERPRTRKRRFGQAQGINERRRERWTTRWEETEGQRRVVEKAVQELGEDGEVLQEWVEITEENLMTGECSVTKRGEDYREKNEEFRARSWVHNTRRGRRRKGRDTAASFSDAAAARGGTNSDACAGDRGAPAAVSKGATETRGAAHATAGICRPVLTAAAEEESEKALRPVGMDVLQLQREEEKQRRSTGETDAEEGEAAYEGEEEEELIEETKGGVTRGQRRRREVASGREEHSVWYRKEAPAAGVDRAAAGGGEKETARGEEAEIWQDTWIEDPQQGKKWGSKSGVNTRQV